MSNVLSRLFDSVRMPDLTDRVADAASGQQYLGIADGGHDRIEVHETTSSKPFMEGLARGGIKHLCIESFDNFTESIFNSYRDGEISDDDLQAIGQELFITTAEKDFGVDPERSRQSMIDYMKHAKGAGIDLHKINNMEGFYTEDDAKKFEHEENMIAGCILSIVNSPEYEKVAADEKSEYIWDKFNEISEQDPELDKSISDVASVMQSRQERVDRELKTYVEEGLDPKTAITRVTSEMMTDRFNRDSQVSDRIKERFGDEKVAVIYGKGHFLRNAGDIDEELGDMAVVNVYADDKQEQTIGPLEDAILSLVDASGEGAEYSYNAGSNTWRVGEDPAISLSSASEQGQTQDAVAMDPVGSGPVQYDRLNT